MGEKSTVIRNYKLSKAANNTSITVFGFCALVYGLALLGFEYEPLSKFIGWIALCVAIAINSPKMKIWVKESQEQSSIE